MAGLRPREAAGEEGDGDGMTDEELGRKLAEACWFRTGDDWYQTPNEFDTVITGHLYDLATSIDAIVRDVFPVLKDRYPTLRVAVRYGVMLGGHSWVEVWADEMPAVNEQWSHYAEDSQGSPRALAEACLAALTEVTA